VFLVFTLLHVHAYRLRDQLKLNELERFETRDNLREAGLNAAIGLLSIGIAMAAAPGARGWRGWPTGWWAR
jgi:hypothetical protein